MPKSHPPYRLAVLILAAGQSQRMGRRNKLLMPMGQQPLLIKTLNKLRNHLPRNTPFYVVTGHQRKQIHALLEAKAYQAQLATEVYNPHFKQGLYSSVFAGVQAIKAASQSSAITHVLLQLADCPQFQPLTLHQLWQQSMHHPRTIIRPSYEGMPGHPVIFPLAALSQLPNTTEHMDRGLQPLFAQSLYPQQTIPCQDQGVITDIDDYQDWLRHH